MPSDTLRAAHRPRPKTWIMNKKLFYEAPEAECLEVTVEGRFLIDSLTDFEEPATMTTIKDKSEEGGIWQWM